MSMAYKYAMTETFCIRAQDMTDADARSVVIPEHSERRTRSGGNPKRSRGRQRKADPETGEIQHNLQPRMLDEMRVPTVRSS